MVKTYFVGKSVAVHLCNKKLIPKVPILLHTGQNECSVLTTAVCQTRPRKAIFQIFKFLLKISKVAKNIQRGDPSMQKLKISKKNFFSSKILFFLPENELYMN